MNLWSGKALKERCILFHRQFGNHRINPTLLRKVYHIHKIKNKKIKKTKPINPDKEIEYENWRLEIKDKIKNLKARGYRIIYLDETLFTTKTLKSYDYTLKSKPHRIPLASINQPCQALIFAISEENGIEHTKVFKKSVDHSKFIEYLDELSILNKHEPICIFLDNLRVHIMEEVMMKMNELQFEVIRNVPYNPDFNPAESCLSKIKNHYRR